MIKLSTQCSKVYACYVWKQWEIWLQNCKMDTKTMQCMWILNTNDAWKKKLFKNIEIENFLVLIDRTSIESGRVKPKNFNRNFDWSKNRFVRLKVWKNQIFEKQSILMQKLLKTHCFIKKMHEYETKSFSKTLEFNLDFPKSRFSINLSSKRKH